MAESQFISSNVGRGFDLASLNELEALVTVAHEAKGWIATHVLKR